MGPRISQPLALLLMPCSKAAPRLTPEAPHCPSLLTPSHLPHPGPVQSCIPKVHLHPPSLHFSPSFLTFHLIFPLSASALSSIPNTDRSDPSSHHKIPPTHHKPGGQMSPTATELLCWGFSPHPGVFYDPRRECWAGWVHRASAKPQSSV